RGFYELRSDPITADQISKWATHRGRSAPQRRGSEVFEIQRFTALFLGHPGEQFAQPLVVGVADPQRAGLVVIEVETTRASRDPELAKRRLATEDQLRAGFEAHGQHSARVVQIDVQTTVIEHILDFFLHRIDKVVEARFAKAHDSFSYSMDDGSRRDTPASLTGPARGCRL